MMFVWIVLVDAEHWEICEHCEWLNIVLMVIEYLLDRNEIKIVLQSRHGQIKPMLSEHSSFLLL